MNVYKWTREKFLEYRKLKRSGYTHSMLKEHFGDDIYESGMYNRNGSTLPNILKYHNFVNEIKINPEETYYGISPELSSFFKEKTDYVLTFHSNNISYVICLIFFKINNIDTYNLVFTTYDQWVNYRSKFSEFIKSGKISTEEFQILNDIISKTTNLNDVYPIFRKISWILLDFYSKTLKGGVLSIGDTDNEQKIKFYRNIIKDSFTNVKESEVKFNGENYYLYEIPSI